jgi:hypothetical protein
LWIEEFRNQKDQSERPVFTRNTEKVATEQLKKVHHSSDIPGMDMYQEILPGPRSTHGLSKWRCDRPESPLEKFHELLAHFGNSGMNRVLADTLTLGGTTEFNIKMRWKAEINKRKLEGGIVDIAGDFIDLPRFFDHSYLDYLNNLAENCGLPPIFDDVHRIGKNNGEVYLSKYFEEQMVRNQTVGQDKKTSMCLCPACTTYLSSSKNTQITRFQPPEDNNNDNNDASTIYLPVVPPAAPPFFRKPPPSTPASSFVPPPILPLTQLAYAGGWLRPNDCCNMVGNFYCANYDSYLRKKINGVQILGKPPHDSSCPVRRFVRRHEQR